MDKNRELHELLGLCWHEYVNSPKGLREFECSCGKGFDWSRVIDKHIRELNPDYTSDPRLVLREMVKREDWPEFYGSLHSSKIENIKFHAGTVKRNEYSGTIGIRYILDTTGMMEDLAIEWLKAL